MAEVRDAFWINLKLLQFEVPSTASSSSGNYGPSMFKVPNETGLLTVLHFLLAKLGGHHKEAVDAHWPCLYDRRQTTTFKKVALSVLAELAADGLLPPTRGSVLSTARGAPAEKLVWHVSTHVLLEHALKHPVLAAEAESDPSMAMIVERLRFDESSGGKVGGGGDAFSMEALVNATKARAVVELVKLAEFRAMAERTEAAWRDMEAEVAAATAAACARQQAAELEHKRLRRELEKAHAAQAAQADVARGGKEDSDDGAGGHGDERSSYVPPRFLSTETAQIERSRNVVMARRAMDQLAAAVAEEERQDAGGGEEGGAAPQRRRTPFSETLAHMAEEAKRLRKSQQLSETAEAAAPCVLTPDLLRNCAAALHEKELQCAQAAARIPEPLRTEAALDARIHLLRRAVQDHERAAAVRGQAEARGAALIDEAAKEAADLRRQYSMQYSDSKK